MTIEHHEVEDFEKTVSFHSGQFAIIDAEIVKSLKDKINLSEKAVFVATKQSRGVASPFKITVEYDDATLRRLTIEPAAANEGPDHEQMEEGIQINGKGGDPVERAVRGIGRIGGTSKGGRPNTQKRSERNKRYSSKGDQKTKLIKGKSSVEQRVDQALSIDGAKRDNYGQPRSKVETECMELLAIAQKGVLTEDYLSSLSYAREIRQVLADVRDNARVSGKSFDLVYKVIQTLDEHWHKSTRMWIEDIAKQGKRLLDGK